jgi:hypothetical protein
MAKRFDSHRFTREGSDQFTSTAPKGALIVRLYDAGTERVYVYRLVKETR